MRYQTGQTIRMQHGYSLKIDFVNEEADEIDATLRVPPPTDWSRWSDCEWIPYDGVSASTIDAIIAHHNRR